MSHNFLAKFAYATDDDDVAWSSRNYRVDGTRLYRYLCWQLSVSAWPTARLSIPASPPTHTIYYLLYCMYIKLRHFYANNVFQEFLLFIVKIPNVWMSHIWKSDMCTSQWMSVCVCVCVALLYKLLLHLFSKFLTLPHMSLSAGLGQVFDAGSTISG